MAILKSTGFNSKNEMSLEYKYKEQTESLIRQAEKLLNIPGLEVKVNNVELTLSAEVINFSRFASHFVNSGVDIADLKYLLENPVYYKVELEKIDQFIKDTHNALNKYYPINYIFLKNINIYSVCSNLFAAESRENYSIVFSSTLINKVHYIGSFYRLFLKYTVEYNDDHEQLELFIGTMIKVLNFVSGRSEFLEQKYAFAYNSYYNDLVREKSAESIFIIERSFKYRLTSFILSHEVGHLLLKHHKGEFNIFTLLGQNRYYDKIFFQEMEADIFALYTFTQLIDAIEESQKMNFAIELAFGVGLLKIILEDELADPFFFEPRGYPSSAETYISVMEILIGSQWMINKSAMKMAAFLKQLDLIFKTQIRNGK